ncbi:hypothetical protein BA768_15860 [Chryseobacterium sp. CBo1]|nr:hypothetical protein BA768_15860 [Chryseobacterium sp. CBo1]
MLNISFFRIAQDFKNITGKIFHSLGSVNINGENFFIEKLKSSIKVKYLKEAFRNDVKKITFV